MESLFVKITDEILGYLLKLDWSYILTLMLLIHLVNQKWITTRIVNTVKISWASKYRNALLGAVYAVVVYILRDYSPPMAESLFASFLFTLVFHKLVSEAIEKWILRLANKSTFISNHNHK